MKIAVIGDFHIPSRSRDIPTEIYRKLEEEKPDLILSTGDIGREQVLNKLKKVAEVKMVRGNMDNSGFPESVEEKIMGYKILLIHGDQARPRGNEDQLRYIAEDEHADILISGHTHVMKTTRLNDAILLNPGSATGAWSGGGAEPDPSFITLKIKEDKAIVKKIRKDKEEEEIYELN